MASLPLSNLSFLLLSLLFVVPTVLRRNGFNLGAEKKTHLHFYFHDIITSPKNGPTAVRVAGVPNASSSRIPFGDILVADDPLTEGPELSSRLVGRAQGLYGIAAREELAFLMVFSFVFTEGEYKGSTLVVVGRDPILSETVREIPIVGGTGRFRGARGYALEKTHSIDFDTLNAVVEYDFHVTHY